MKSKASLHHLATLIVQCVDYWNYIATPPRARINYNLNLLWHNTELACREATNTHYFVAC
jgi:hypothetical protein